MANMRLILQVAAHAAFSFMLVDYCGFANAQRPQGSLAPESSRPEACTELNIDGRASSPLLAVVLPPLQFCTTRLSNGFPVPDPNCTPGASNPTLTIEVLKDRRFSTGCVRDAATGQQEKAVTYDWYNLPHP